MVSHVQDESLYGVKMIKIVLSHPLWTPSFGQSTRVVKVSPKGHKRRLLVRSDDPLDDGVSDLVVDQPVLGAADEELVLTERRAEWERTT